MKSNIWKSSCGLFCLTLGFGGACDADCNGVWLMALAQPSDQHWIMRFTHTQPFITFNHSLAHYMLHSRQTGVSSDFHPKRLSGIVPPWWIPHPPNNLHGDTDCNALSAGHVTCSPSVWEEMVVLEHCMCSHWSMQQPVNCSLLR